ncbi:MAG: TonB-dependent receptor [Pseudomonadales bacterium]|nr:TonB-dependent receptor [Pseudomonadales bacterium]
MKKINQAVSSRKPDISKSSFKQFSFNKLRLAMLASGLLTGMAGMHVDSALAQDAQADGGALEEIQVTGSRILRRDFESSSPIMTVDQTFFEETSLLGVESVLNRLPQFNPAVTQFDTGDVQATAVNTPGASTLSLRGLGSNRNLILLNGRRAMPVNASGAVDVNMIPSSAIQRVETISGGSSSTYGSDAMAGAVNFILKQDFEGFELNGQWGSTDDGDDVNRRLSGLVGANLDGGRGNVMIGWDYSRRGAVFRRDRKFFTDGFDDPTTGAVGGNLFVSRTEFTVDAANPPDSAVVNDIFGTAPGTVGANAGTFLLNNDGTVFKNTADGSFRFNDIDETFENSDLNRFKRTDENTLVENDIENMLSIPLERTSLFFNGTFDITDDVSAFAQATFARNETRTNLLFSPAVSAWATPIPHGSGIFADSLNPDGSTAAAFLPGGLFGLNCPEVGGCTNSQAFPVPSELAAILDSRVDPNAPWQMGHQLDWAGNRRTKGKTETFQLMMGISGTLPFKDWTWDMSGSIGNSDVTTNFEGFASLERTRAVLSSPNFGRNFSKTGNTDVPFGGGFGGGRATCTTGLPINSEFIPSQDCFDAVLSPLQNNSKMEQNVAEINLQGGVFELPAGEVRMAVGFQYREQLFEFKTDILTSQGSFLDSSAGLFPASDSAGETRTRDYFGELLLPLFSNLPLVQQFNVEMGYRFSNNSPSNNTSTWKVLGDWRLHDKVRIRGGRQVANRAPNIGELFQSRTQTLGITFVGDFCSEANPVNGFSANPALNPNAAQVRAICSELAGPTGAANFYDPSNDQPSNSFGFSFVNSVGNPNLKSERARTFTIGAVFNPIENMTLSVDWYSIEIDDLISVETAEAVGNQCFNPLTNPTFDPNFGPCTRLVRDPVTGGQAPVDVTFSNQAFADTQGLDVQFDYNYELNNGGLGLNVQFNYIDKFATQTTPDSPLVDAKGTLGPNNVSGINGGAFDFRTFTTLSYFHNSGLNASLRWRFLPSIKSSAAATNPNTTVQPTDEYNIVDFAMTYRFSALGDDNTSLRFGIDNLMNADPESTGIDLSTTTPTSASSGAGTTSSEFFDILGRRFFVGFTTRF